MSDPVEHVTTRSERAAILARAYGGGEITVARVLGRYPVPHDDLDRVERMLQTIPGGWSP